MRDDLQPAVAEFVERTKVVMPMIREHFRELRMDTAEDEEMRTRMLGMVEWWAAAVDTLRALEPSEEDNVEDWDAYRCGLPWRP